MNKAQSDEQKKKLEELMGLGVGRDDPRAEVFLIENYRSMLELIGELRGIGSAEQIALAEEVQALIEEKLRRIFGNDWLTVVKSGPAH